IGQRGRSGDRPPSVVIPFGIKGEVHSDVLARVTGRSVSGGRAGDHQAGAGGEPAAKRVVYARVDCVAHAEVVAVDDNQLCAVPAGSTISSTLCRTGCQSTKTRSSVACILCGSVTSTTASISRGWVLTFVRSHSTSFTSLFFPKPRAPHSRPQRLPSACRISM